MSTLYSALVRYAGTIQGGPDYHAEKLVTWQIDLHPDGRPVSHSLLKLTTTTTDPRSGAVKVTEGARHVVPSLVRARGARALVTCDDIAYVLGWSDGAVSAAECGLRHRLFREVTEQWATSEWGLSDPLAQAVARFLTDGHAERMEKPAEWTSKQSVMFTVDGTPAHSAPSVAPFWARWVEGTDPLAEDLRLCVICGQAGKLVEKMPQMVKGAFAPGGQSSGVAPISINEAVYGYGLKKGLGLVPICVGCARDIPAALNHLLGDRSRTDRTSDSAMTWWLEGPVSYNPFTLLSAPSVADVKQLIAGVYGGQRGAPTSLSMFHSLVVSGNAARLVIRDWRSLPVETLQRHVAEWFVDQEIAELWSTGTTYMPIWRLATCAGRFDNATQRYLPLGTPGARHPHGILENLRGAALFHEPLPGSLLAHLLSRITADQRVDGARASLIRLLLIRRAHRQEIIMPGLDPTSTDPCYVAGRLFAHYEAIQYASATDDGGSAPRATFAQRHLAGAISDPRTALIAGEKQSAAWFNRLRRTGKDVPYQRTLDEIMGQLAAQDALPARSTLDEQARFILGYHHQRAHVFARIAAAKTARLDEGDAALAIDAV